MTRTSLRVLLLAPQPFYAPRGTPIAVRAVAQAISAAGHRVDILTLPYGEDVELPNIQVRRVGRIPLISGVPIGPSWQKLLYDVRLVRAARRILQDGRYDVIHGVEEGAVLAWWLSGRKGNRLPYVYDMDSHLSAQIREANVLYAPLAHLSGYLERAALRNASGVLAVCPALAEVARRYRSADGVALLPDTPLFRSEDEEPAEEIGRFEGVRLLYVGNLEKYQGIDLLLEAFRLVAQGHSDARLIIVGGSDEAIQDYSRRFADLVELGQLHFLGPRPLSQLGSILLAADILVSPRLQGVNTPMKIYSYLESGRPVVATRLETHTQVLTDDAAWLVEPDPDSLAAGLSRLVEDPELRRTVGRNGRDLVRRDFGPERFQERVTAFYDEIAQRIAASRGEGAPAGFPTPTAD